MGDNDIYVEKTKLWEELASQQYCRSVSTDGWFPADSIKALFGDILRRNRELEEQVKELKRDVGSTAF